MMQLRLQKAATLGYIGHINVRPLQALQGITP
jgi:hypothetical protein